MDIPFFGSSSRPSPLSRTCRALIDDVSKPRRTVTAKIATASLDRQGIVIVPSGGRLRRFKRTPAVLWEHGLDPTRGRLPIGLCTDLRYRAAKDDILATTQFKTDEYSDRIFQNYVDATLSAFSIDLIPEVRGAGVPTREELKAHPEWGTAHTIYRHWELTGYSAVSYAANPEALAVAVQRGLYVRNSVRFGLPHPWAKLGYVYVYSERGLTSVRLPQVTTYTQEHFTLVVSALMRAVLGELESRFPARRP